MRRTGDCGTWSVPCPVCHGAAAAAGSPRGHLRRAHHRRARRAAADELAAVLRRTAELTDPARVWSSSESGDDRGRGADRPGPAWHGIQVLERTRAGLPEPGPDHHHALARGDAAAAAGHPAARRALRGRLRSRRALGRTAPGRRRTPVRGPGPAEEVGQLPVRRRARPGRRPPRRLGRRRRPRCGPDGGRVLYSGPVAGLAGHRGLRDPPVPLRDERPPRCAPPRHRRGWLHLRGHNQTQPAGTSTPTSPWVCSPRSPGYPARASRRSSPRCWPTWSPGGSGSTPPDAGTTSRTTARGEAEWEWWPRASRPSTGWCGWTRSPSAGPRARTWPPTPACSTPCASCSPHRGGPRRGYDGGPLLLQRRRRDGVRPARARASSPSNCCSCQAPTRRAPRATARATTPETLEVRYRGKHHRRRAALTVDEAVGVLRRRPRRVRAASATLQDVGLGYLRLGQPRPNSPAARRSASSWPPNCSARRGHTLYLLDEPTTGLHPADVDRLHARSSHRLVDAGQHGGRRGARHGRRRRRRLGHRPRPGRRGRRRADRRRGHSSRGGAGEGEPDGALRGGVSPSRGCGAPPGPPGSARSTMMTAMIGSRYLSMFGIREPERVAGQGHAERPDQAADRPARG